MGDKLPETRLPHAAKEKKCIYKNSSQQFVLAKVVVVVDVAIRP